MKRVRISMGARPKFYFADEIESEFCYPIDFYKQIFERESLEKIKLTEAIILQDKSVFYCSAFQSVGEIAESDCGNSCKEYNPRNGKSGRCRYSKSCYEHGVRKFVLTISGLKEIKQGVAADI